MSFICEKVRNLKIHILNEGHTKLKTKMSNWEVALCRAVGLLWLCLAQTGEAGDNGGFGMIIIISFFSRGAGGIAFGV